MMKILVILDKIVDIMNVNKKNGCNNIHSPAHIHLNQLLGAEKVFNKWKKNWEGKGHFIPESTYENLFWMVFAVVGVAKTYLKDDKSCIMLLKKSGTDICEHPTVQMPHLTKLVTTPPMP
jgi:hypothetical protein